MLFPLRDINPTVRRPVATLGLIALNIATWALVQGFGNGLVFAQSLCSYGLIPAALLDLASSGTVIPLTEEIGCELAGSLKATLLTHMFLHGGWFHLISNMWFLWVFGDNVEDALGPLRFVAFYLLCGLAAASLQIMTQPNDLIPMVGASGAIGGVLGGYARLYPRAYIVNVLFLGVFFTTIALPAFVMLGYWFILQLAGALPALHGVGAGVAFWAHIGGFVAGLVLVWPLHRHDYYAQHLARARSRPGD